MGGFPVSKSKRKSMIKKKILLILLLILLLSNQFLWDGPVVMC